MFSNEFFIRILFYTNKRYIGEEIFPNNITLFDIKKYYKQNLFDGTTLLYKNYYINEIKISDSDIISKLVPYQNNILEISLAIELREIEDLKNQFDLIKFDDEEDEVYTKIIKPKFNPFGLIVFFTKNNQIQIEQYPEEIIKKFNLGNLNNNNLSYCNSPNYLFLSSEKNFWIINKKTYSITHKKLIISKNNHSIIYVPDIGVYVVGGDTKKTFFYNIKTGKFNKWGDTVNYHHKPALIYYDEYLYCFNSLNEKCNYFEKTYLGENTQKVWEIIYPRFKDINPREIYNNDFAISKSTEGKILLIGSKSDKNNKNIYIYNPLNDTLIKTDGDNEAIIFGEKLFYKLNKIINIAIPSDFEQSNELAILNKYQFSLKKIKYKTGKKGININYNLGIDNNLELINDNQIGNFSLQVKFDGINQMNERFVFLRTFGIPVFNQLNYIKLRQSASQRCICHLYNINHESQRNIFKNELGMKQQKPLKKNYSQKAMIKNFNYGYNNQIDNNIINVNKNQIKTNQVNKQIPKSNVNIIPKKEKPKMVLIKNENIEIKKDINQIKKKDKNKNLEINITNNIKIDSIQEENKSENVLKETTEKENQNIKKEIIIQKANDLEYKTEINNNNEIIQDNNDKENIDMKKINNNINNNEINNEVNEDKNIIESNFEENSKIKEDINININESNNIKDNNQTEEKDNIKEENKIKEDNLTSEEMKKIMKESIKFNIKPESDNDKSYTPFSNIKEIRNNPNYDLDESKLNKDNEENKTNLTNFQFKESTHSKIISDKLDYKLSDSILNFEKIPENENENKENQNQKIDNIFDNIEIKLNNEENKEKEKSEENTNTVEKKQKDEESEKNKQISEYKYELNDEDNKNENYGEENGGNNEEHNEENEKEEEGGNFEEQYQEEEYEDHEENIGEEQDNNHMEVQNGQDNKEFNNENNIIYKENDLGDSIEQEINQQEVHEDIEPNYIIRQKNNINLNFKNNDENNNMAQNTEQKEEKEQEEEIINNEQDDQELDNISNNRDNSKNDEEFNIESSEQKKYYEKKHSDDITAKFEVNYNYKKENNEKNIENMTDLNINNNQEGSKEIEIESNNEINNISKELKNSIHQNDLNNLTDQEHQQSASPKNLNNINGQYIINQDNISNNGEEEEKNDNSSPDSRIDKNFEINNEENINITNNKNNEENNVSIELRQEEKGNYDNNSQEHSGELYEEEMEEHENMDNEEMNGEENEEEEEHYEEQNVEENEDDVEIENGNKRTDMSYEPEEENDNNGKDSIIHISSDNINSHETNKKKGKNLKKYQKYVKNVEYDEFNDDNNI